MQIEGLPVTKPDNLKLSPAEIAKLERGSGGTAGDIGSFVGTLFYGQGHTLDEACKTIAEVIAVQAPESSDYVRGAAATTVVASYGAQEYIFGQNDKENTQ